MIYEILDGQGNPINTVTAEEGWLQANYPGRYRFLRASAPVVDPTQWLIDVGPFFDRFGAAKMPLLVSTNATVRALIADIQVRKWIDLQRPDVGQAIDALIALGISGMTQQLKTSILTTPVTAEENLALRKLYFGG